MRNTKDFTPPRVLEECDLKSASTGANGGIGAKGGIGANAANGTHITKVATRTNHALNCDSFCMHSAENDGIHGLAVDGLAGAVRSQVSGGCVRR